MLHKYTCVYIQYVILFMQYVDPHRLISVLANSDIVRPAALWLAASPSYSGSK